MNPKDFSLPSDSVSLKPNDPNRKWLWLKLLKLAVTTLCLTT